MSRINAAVGTALELSSDQSLVAWCWTFDQVLNCTHDTFYRFFPLRGVKSDVDLFGLVMIYTRRR